ncbi:hypothetical protein [Piscinibacter koreensis]|uniref:SIR2-like domain-containing protein n=1 Tax=Piscinibacter koreensis TaxID=2742824 RepID=A0A7Y6NQT7_9BURK|nr:hypothetical protein [Schlegelella koreensis]NUZ07616.1 hypothetical protein [Schlegelella koreensis]
MIKKNTVLVLGAGASHPYGLPLGSGLADNIKALSGDAADALPIRGPHATGLGVDFIRSFRRSNDRSIDAFLARRLDFEQIGTLAIAACLLPAERLDKLVDGEPAEDHWYRYLLDAMDGPWEDLAANRISFVTFNYDRSLECFLTVALANRFGRSEKEAAQLVKSFNIVHVYGSLGSLDPDAEDFVPYGGHPQNMLNSISMAGRGLRVIAQGRDDSKEFTEARALLADAEVLCFLGFGFDEMNLRRLGGPAAIQAGGSVDSNRPMTTRRFAASAYGLTPAEVSQATQRIAHVSFAKYVREDFHDAKCLATLRRTLII